MSTYPNQFARIGISDAAVLSRLSDCFSTIFFSPENNFYHPHPTDPDSACMVDTGNNDARTEGMSYGMMMCVQMNRKDLFDKLWTFSMRYMHLSSGVHQGYFAWSVQLDGKHNAEGPAPDGEEYFAMALLMASARWDFRISALGAGYSAPLRASGGDGRGRSADVESGKSLYQVRAGDGNQRPVVSSAALLSPVREIQRRA